MRRLIQERTLHSILNRNQRKWELISSYVKKLPEEPMLLITEIFKGGDLFLAERLMQEGEDILLEAQSYWMSLLLPVLSKTFETPEISIQYDESIPLAPILFVENERVIALCCPYRRVFQSVGIPGFEELVQERANLYFQLEEKEKEFEQNCLIEENPVLLGENDQWLFTKVTLNPKKYKKMAHEKGIVLQQELQSIKQQIDSVDLKIEMAKNNYLETSHYLDRIKTRVAKWGGFQFIEPEEEGE